MSTHRAIIAVSVRTQVVTRRRVSAPGTAAMSAVAPAARLSDVRQRSRARAALTARASACSRGIAGIAGLLVVPGPGGRHTSRGRVSVVTHAAGAKKKRSPEEIRARRELREQREAREAEEAELAAFEAEEAAARSGAGEESGEEDGYDAAGFATGETGETAEVEVEEEEVQVQALAPTRSASELRPRSTTRSSQYRSALSPPPSKRKARMCCSWEAPQWRSRRWGSSCGGRKTAAAETPTPTRRPPRLAA